MSCDLHVKKIALAAARRWKERARTDVKEQKGATAMR